MRKNWKTKGGVILILAVVSLTLVGTAWAWKGSDHPDGSQIKGKGVRAEMRLDLNLTPAQRKEIAEFRLSWQEETVDLRGQLMKYRIQLKRLWLEETPDRNNIYVLIDEMAGIRAEMQKKAIDFGLQLKEILTPEQGERLWEKFSLAGFGGRLGMDSQHGMGHSDCDCE